MDFVGGGYNDHFAEIEIDNKRHIDEVRIQVSNATTLKNTSLGDLNFKVFLGLMFNLF